jgi:predicted DNA-binding protein (MmcQ/YjbR family)
MDTEIIRSYALSKSDVEESLPFGDDVLVFKTNNKIFLLLPLTTQPVQFNAKCNPEKAVELREQYPDNVLPGYHMNKKHWNTIVCENLKLNFIKEMIDDSYDLISPKKKITKSEK